MVFHNTIILTTSPSAPSGSSWPSRQRWRSSPRLSWNTTLARECRASPRFNWINVMRRLVSSSIYVRVHKLLGELRKGEVLLVWKLDQLSRSLRDVLTIMERIQEKKAGFRSLTEAVFNTSPAPRMMMQMVGAFAEFERAMLKERTHAGLEAARKEGRIGGRPPKLTAHQRLEIVKLVTQGK